MANENQIIIGAGQDTARPAPKTKSKPVLDVCCGPRMMWFDKHDNRATFHDRRNVDIQTNPNAAYKNGKVFSIRPDVCGSFASMQFPDNTFYHVVFDPPHFVETDPNSKMLMRVQYGQLADGWKEEIRSGFSECFRILRPFGTLVFKWCEYDVPVSEILKLTEEKPLYGHRSGKQSKTHWLVFIKGEESPVLGEESPAQNTMEICHTAPNSAMLQGLKPHAGGTGTSA
jgi:SAM-dependent methyltransferase